MSERIATPFGPESTAAGAARVVSVSSVAHLNGPVLFDDIRTAARLWQVSLDLLAAARE